MTASGARLGRVNTASEVAMPATAAKPVPVRSAGTNAASHQALTGTSLIGVSDEFTNAGLAASHSAANNPVPAPAKSRPRTNVNHTVNPASAGTTR